MSDKTLIVLYTYGGGMRGLVAAHLLNQIEEKTGLPMAKMVDIFAGSSTGSIINTALNIPHPSDRTKPKFKARHLVRFYEREGPNIFPYDAFREMRSLIHDFNNRLIKIGKLNKLLQHGHYNPVNLGRSLRTMYGNLTLQDTLKSTIISTYNIERGLTVMRQLEESDPEMPMPKNPLHDEGGHAVWLKHLRFPGRVHRQRTPDIALYDAVMASTAAPTYFPCHRFQYDDDGTTRHITGIDGSIFDNPCITWAGALRHHIPRSTKVIFLCIGTGYTNQSITQEQWNRYGALGLVDPVNELPLINIFFHASETALYDSFRQELEGRIYVLNKSLSLNKDGLTPGTAIDNATPENMNRMRSFAQCIIDENQTAFDHICNMLVQNYERRDDSSGLLSRLGGFLRQDNEL